MTKRIVLAGGCFWGTQAYFERLKGVEKTKVGYAQSNVENPSYEEVKAQGTHAAEAVAIDYDPDEISLSDLIHHLFRFIDPTVADRQAHDIGTQYRTGIYALSDEDLAEAKAVLSKLQSNYAKPILTEVQPLKNFYPAEEYHQFYLDKNPNGYCHVDLSLLKPEERKKN